MVSWAREVVAGEDHSWEVVGVVLRDLNNYEAAEVHRSMPFLCQVHRLWWLQRDLSGWISQPLLHSSSHWVLHCYYCYSLVRLGHCLVEEVVVVVAMPVGGQSRVNGY